MKKIIFLVLFSFVAACSKNHSLRAASRQTPIPDASSTSTKNTQNDTVPLRANAPNIYEYDSTSKGEISVHIYSDNDVWIIDQFKIDSDGLPTRLGKKIFTTKEKAYAYATDILGLKESQRNDKSLDQEPKTKGKNSFSQNLSSDKVLWEAKNAWNWDWEIKFAKWMRENMHPNFFLELGIENDCADAYYQARTIFSRINSLPVAFRLSGGGAWFTEKTMRKEWLKLKTDGDWKKDKRFLKALDYLADTTYTHTLGRDTYPVSITPDGLIEGSAFLYLDDHSGHTLLVNEINNGDSIESKTRLPMYTLNSTVPKEVRPLYESFFYESSQPERNSYGNTGFVRFRWPIKSGVGLVEEKKMPHYSLEQYDPAFMNTDDANNDQEQQFSILVFKRLNPNFDPVLRITEGIQEVRDLLEARKDIVTKGYVVCKNGCKEGSADYENWSTPSRDKRLRELMKDLQAYQNSLYGVEGVTKAWEDAQNKTITEIDSVNYTLAHVKWTFDNNFFSSNPNLPPTYRWGLSPQVFAEISKQQIDPIIKNRIKKISDPNPCSNGQCIYFSKQYIETSTFVEDYRAQDIINLRNQYCNVSGESNCQAFHSALSKLPTDVPGHSDYLDTWNKLSFFNSDPSLSVDRRWGQLPDIYDSINIEGNWDTVGFFKNYLVLKTYVDEKKSKVLIIDTVTKSIATTIDTPSFGDITLSTSGIIASADNKLGKLLVIDLTTLASETLDLPKYPLNEQYVYASTTWIDPTHFIASYMGITAILTFVNNKVVHVDTLERYATTDGSPYAIKIENLESNPKKASHFIIHILNILTSTNPSDEIVVDVNTVLPSSLKVGRVFFTTQTSAAVLFGWTAGDDKNYSSGTFAVDTKSSKAYATPELDVYPTTIKNLIIESTYEKSNTKSKYMFIDEYFKVKKTISMNAPCINCYTNGDIIQIGSDLYEIDFKNMELTVIASLSDKQVMSSNYHNYFIFSDQTNEDHYTQNLVDMATGKIILTNAQMTLSSSADGLAPLLEIGFYYEQKIDSQFANTSLSALLDLEHRELGPIFTKPNNDDYEGGGDDGAEHPHDFDAETATEMNSVEPENQFNDGKTSFKVILRKEKKYPEIQDKISIYNNGYNTLILIRK